MKSYIEFRFPTLKITTPAPRALGTSVRRTTARAPTATTTGTALMGDATAGGRGESRHVMTSLTNGMD